MLCDRHSAIEQMVLQHIGISQNFVECRVRPVLVAVVVYCGADEFNFLCCRDCKLVEYLSRQCSTFLGVILRVECRKGVEIVQHARHSGKLGIFAALERKQSAKL